MLMPIVGRIYAFPSLKRSPQASPKVKLLLIGGLAGLVIGVVLTVLYFSLSQFFALNAKALHMSQNAAENRNESAVETTLPAKQTKAHAGRG